MRAHAKALVLEQARARNGASPARPCMCAHSTQRTAFQHSAAQRTHAHPHARARARARNEMQTRHTTQCKRDTHVFCVFFWLMVGLQTHSAGIVALTSRYLGRRPAHPARQSMPAVLHSQNRQCARPAMPMDTRTPWKPRLPRGRRLCAVSELRALAV